MGISHGLSNFFDSMPRKIRTELAKKMFKNSYNDIPFFKNKSESFLVSILPFLIPMKVSQGTMIFKKGSFPNLVYFLLKGRINFVIGEKDINFKTFVAGSYIGETEIFHQCLRLFSVRAEESC